MTENTLPLYIDNGKIITTHSMIKTFRRCPKQTQYKYVDRLKTKIGSLPLERGNWIHALLECYYLDNSWEDKHAALTQKFNDLFDEEKEALGDLPRECDRIMKAYLWHYKQHDWKVHEVEFILEAEFPDGSVYRGKIDLLVEDQYGLWIVDHKSHKILPNIGFRLLDSQSALYIWAAWKNKIPVQGHIWNYIRTKAPTVPYLLKSGQRLSKKGVDTDFLTYVTALKKYKLNLNTYKHEILRLKNQQYRHGELQTSPFFRRDILEKDSRMIKQVVQEAYTTHKRMHSYPWDDVRQIERIPDRSCTYQCPYSDLCQVELFTGNGDHLRRKKYTVGDPLDYYYDSEGEERVKL
jgi:hypothetical protein